MFSLDILPTLFRPAAPTLGKAALQYMSFYVYKIYVCLLQLTISDRSHLLNDVFALAEAQIVSYDVALNLSAYLDVETDYVPWETASSIFSELSDRLLNTTAHDHLEVKY